MGTKISASARVELVRALRERYRTATREERVRILSEFVAVSGYHRKHAIRILNATEQPREPTQRLSRPRLYDEAARRALIVLWEASDRVCGKRLRAMMGLMVAALEKHKHLELDEKVRTKLLAMSAATIDRLLRTTKLTAAPHRRRRATPAIRRSVAIRTFADWKEPAPGSMEIDLVAHCGESMAGRFVHTLVLTDIASGWTECIPLVVREGSVVVEGLEQVRQSLPFALRCLDSDNGGEFINATVVRYCVEHGIELTRSRPWHKNDQAWVEQKNGSVVRRLIGYRRLEGIAAAQGLARLYATSRLFVNFFQPSFKLIEKTRIGATIRKRYETPLTPYARLLVSTSLPEPAKARLRAVAEALDPLRLLDEIRAMQHHLAALADGQQPHTPVARDPDLTRFLASLSTAWSEGEVRPTHRAPSRRPRNWRTRRDPFEEDWPQACNWLEVDPDLTGLELFARLQQRHPGKYPDGQLRTLQRRLRDWRAQAARKLIFGDLTTTSERPPQRTTGSEVEGGGARRQATLERACLAPSLHTSLPINIHR